MEKTTQELDAYERELASELSLREQLPEAFSYSKERMLRTSIATLRAKHLVLSHGFNQMVQDNQPNIVQQGAMPYQGRVPANIAAPVSNGVQTQYLRNYLSSLHGSK